MYSLIANRTPIMFETLACPRCEQLLPRDQAEVLSFTYAQYSMDATDDWYCPWCYYSFANDWHAEEVVWYDEFEMDNGPDDDDEFHVGPYTIDMDFYVCCGTYRSKACDCTAPMTFDRAVATCEKVNLHIDDLYEEDPDNLGCSTCKERGTEFCPELSARLGSIFRSDGMGEKITLCSDYEYDASRTSSYKYKKLTEDLVLTELMKFPSGKETNV